jgi:hypothetical protein
MVFKPVPESEITRAIVTSFIEMFTDFARSDVIVVGAGARRPHGEPRVGEERRQGAGDRAEQLLRRRPLSGKLCERHEGMLRTLLR